MDAFTMALLAQAGAKGIGQLAQSGSMFGQSRDLMLDEEQRKRLKELERLEALNEFGLTPAQREQYQAQALAPVQAAQREAMARFGASQAVGDIGQGAAFRQQQALKEGSEEARAKVAMATAEKEAQAAQQQAAQLEALQAQERKAKQLQRDAALSAIGGVAGALGEAAGLKAEQQAMESLYEKRLDQLSGVQRQTSLATQDMFGIAPVSEIVDSGDSGGSNAPFVPTTREERDTQAEQDLFSQDPALYLSNLADTADDNEDVETMDVNRTLKRLLGGGFGLAKRGRGQTEYYDPTMGITPNSQLTAAQRNDQLGQPVAEPGTQVSGVVEPSNVQQERTVTVPNSNLKGFLVPNGSSIVVPSEDSANPMSITYFDPTTGRNLGKIMFAESQNTEQGRDAWAQATQELRLAMGEGFAGEQAVPAVGSLLDEAVDREMSQIPEVTTFTHTDGTQYQPETDAQGNVIVIYEVTPDGQRFTNRPTDPTWANTLKKYEQAKGGK